MNWELMTAAEVHRFGIESIVPYVEQEGITIENVNLDIERDPQIVGTLQGHRVFVLVRTALYPNKGQLDTSAIERFLEWAAQHQALPLFASVGLACIKYPDRTDVTDHEAMQQPIRNGGFAVSFHGLTSLNRKQ